MKCVGPADKRSKDMIPAQMDQNEKSPQHSRAPSRSDLTSKREDVNMTWGSSVPARSTEHVAAQDGYMLSSAQSSTTTSLISGRKRTSSGHFKDALNDTTSYTNQLNAPSTSQVVKATSVDTRYQQFTEVNPSPARHGNSDLSTALSTTFSSLSFGTRKRRPKHKREVSQLEWKDGSKFELENIR